jgi:DNA polymerase V
MQTQPVPLNTGVFLPPSFETKRPSSELPPLYLSLVPTGFPSPADDYVAGRLDLNELLVRQPAATFFVRNKGLSMVGVGIMDGAYLTVNGSLEPRHGDIVVAAIDGAFTCKRLDLVARCLCPENPDPAFQPIYFQDGEDWSVMGVVTSVINELCTR